MTTSLPRQLRTPATLVSAVAALLALTPATGAAAPVSDAGTAVSVYIIDSGIRATHREFGGRVAQGYSAVHDGLGTADCAGHGTHVAGIVGGATYGVAPHVRLVPVRVLDCTGRGTVGQVIAGVDWVTRHHGKGPAVANLSIVAGSSPELDAAVARSIASGVTYVIAAGNYNSDACAFSPARLPQAITVGASTAFGRRAGYSDHGRCVDLYARGSAVLSACSSGDRAVEMRSGTSMAAPQVAGRVAELLRTDPGAGPAALMSMLR